MDRDQLRAMPDEELTALAGALWEEIRQVGHLLPHEVCLPPDLAWLEEELASSDRASDRR